MLACTLLGNIWHASDKPPIGLDVPASLFHQARVHLLSLSLHAQKPRILRRKVEVSDLAFVRSLSDLTCGVDEHCERTCTLFMRRTTPRGDKSTQHLCGLAGAAPHLMIPTKREARRALRLPLRPHAPANRLLHARALICFWCCSYVRMSPSYSTREQRSDAACSQLSASSLSI